MLVLDASGSMNAQISGRTKLQIARGVVNGLGEDWPQATELGLITYGHREKDNCSDIRTLVKPAADSWPAIRAAADDVEAKGKTPITEACALPPRSCSEEGKGPPSSW
jgi:Ca-activated chloride channel family protein